MTDPTSPTTATTPPPPPSAPTAPVSPPTALTAPPGTALEIAQLLASGTIDTTKAGKLSRAANIDNMTVAKALHTLREVGEAQGPDMRSPEVKELDAHFPPAKPEEFAIHYGVPGQEPAMTPKLKAFDSSARTWLSGAGFPRETGNSLVNAIAKVTQQTQHMTADQLESYGHAEFEKLQKAYGPALEEKLRSAAVMINQLEQWQPGLKNLLKSHGIGDNALVASLLIQQAARYHARRSR